MRMATHENLVGPMQREQLFARPTDELTRATEQGQTPFKTLHRQGGHQILLGREVLIDGPLRILGRLGQPIHGQGGESPAR